ncbi:MAG: helix-turn-helix transcriptional regulator [Lachnospiraceae bacterium]|nr:helix-turn-helix transcriptional regulator [Lachnospiraceae bacterium]
MIKNNNVNELPEINFEQRIKKLRKKSQLSQEQMGELLGIDGKSYGKYEQGTTLPTVDRLMQLSDIFNVSIDYLLFGTMPSTIERVSSLLGRYDASVQEKVLVCVENMLSMMFPDSTP